MRSRLLWGLVCFLLPGLFSAGMGLGWGLGWAIRPVLSVTLVKLWGSVLVCFGEVDWRRLSPSRVMAAGGVPLLWPVMSVLHLVKVVYGLGVPGMEYFKAASWGEFPTLRASLSGL